MGPSGFVAVIAVLVVAGIGHAVVIKTDAFARLARPIDGGRSFRGQPIFGPNKTWRGVIVMATGSAAAAAVLLPPSAIRVDLNASEAAVAGWVMGIGYVAAELPNSFVKRRLRIPAGATNGSAPFIQAFVDQADSVVGVTIIVAILFPIGPGDAVILIVAGVAAHELFDVLMHALGVKRRIR